MSKLLVNSLTIRDTLRFYKWYNMGFKGLVLTQLTRAKKLALFLILKMKHSKNLHNNMSIEKQELYNKIYFRK